MLAVLKDFDCCRKRVKRSKTSHLHFVLPKQHEKIGPFTVESHPQRRITQDHGSQEKQLFLKNGGGDDPQARFGMETSTSDVTGGGSVSRAPMKSLGRSDFQSEAIIDSLSMSMRAGTLVNRSGFQPSQLYTIHGGTNPGFGAGGLQNYLSLA